MLHTPALQIACTPVLQEVVLRDLCAGILLLFPVQCDWGGRTLLLPLPLSLWWIELAVGSLGCGFCWLWRILVQLVSCQYSCLLECAGISDQGLD